MLKDEEGNHSLVAYPWYSVMLTNFVSPPSTKVKTGLSVIEFTLSGTGECNHCLGLHNHPFGMHAQLCSSMQVVLDHTLETPSLTCDHDDIVIDECQFFQNLKEKDLYRHTR